MEISNYIWNMDIFLTITHVIAIIGLYLSPEPCEARFFILRVLDWARTIFNITPIVFD